MVYIKNDRIIDADTNVVIRDPAVLISDDTFIKYGNVEDVQREFEKVPAILEYTMIDLSELPVEDACYIIRRMFEHTASGFVRGFKEHFADYEGKNHELGFDDWLNEEIKKVPINVNRPLYFDKSVERD